MADNRHAQLAEVVSRLFPGALPDFDQLKLEVAYRTPSLHTVWGRLALVQVDCDRGGEDAPGFADGSAGSASCRVRATTHWLVGKERFRLVCVGRYGYSIHGHSGGVGGVDGEPGAPEGFPRVVPLARSEHALMRSVARASACSIHKDADDLLGGADLPPEFVVRLCHDLDLTSSRALAAAELAELEAKEGRPWQEWEAALLQEQARLEGAEAAKAARREAKEQARPEMRARAKARREVARAAREDAELQELAEQAEAARKRAALREIAGQVETAPVVALFAGPAPGHFRG